MARDDFSVDELARAVADSLQATHSSRDRTSGNRISARAVASTVVRQLSSDSRLSLRSEFRTDRPLSVDVVASVVAHRLRMGNRIKGVPIDAIVSAVARRLAVTRESETAEELASAIARRVESSESGDSSGERDLPVHHEDDPASTTGSTAG